MKDQEFSATLMDKLAGNLSENDARAFEETVRKDKTMEKNYQFFTQVWDDLGEIDEKHEVTDSLSQKFYTQLAEEQKKEENTFLARLLRFKEQISSVSPMSRNISFGLFLLAFGFILGGKFNTQKIEVNHRVEPATTNDNQNVSFVLSTDKIQQIHALGANTQMKDETIAHLKSIIKTEENTNVRLAALNQLNKSNQGDSFRQFYLQQLEKEQSPLIQVALLNSVIESSRTKETINTMETMLANRRLNPIVYEKIKKDLPVLRASYVE